MPARKSSAKKSKATETSYLHPPAEQPMLYINNIEISFSVFDVQIRLNRVVQKEGDKVLLLNQGTVAMSPQHALSFWSLLGNALTAYQQEHGQLAGSETITSEHVQEVD